MRLLFFIADLISFTLITAIVVTLRYGEFSHKVFDPTIKVLLPVFALTSLILWVFSFYDTQLIKKGRLDYSNIIIAFALSLCTSAFGIYFTTSFFNVATPKFILLLVFVLYFSYMYISRKSYASFNLVKQRILLLGKSNTLKEIEKDLASYDNFEVLGRFENPDDIKEIPPESIDLIVMASKMLSENKNTWPVISTIFLNKGVLLATDYNFYEHLFMRSSKGSLKDAMWLIRGVAARQEEKYYPLIKRALDILFCLVLMPVMLPLGILTYLAIKFVDKMPPFFLQERIGKNEKKIYIYKFRTMKPGSEDITKLGAVLRRFRLDEIPQLINILKGDISIVGPRPLWTQDYYFLNKHLSCHNIRSVIKPGLTGWAQLNFKAPPTYCVREDLKDKENIPDSVFDAAYKRLSYDIWYIKNRSLFLDLEIMLKTAKRAFIKDKNIA